MKPKNTQDVERGRQTNAGLENSQQGNSAAGEILRSSGNSRRRRLLRRVAPPALRTHDHVFWEESRVAGQLHEGWNL